MTYQADQKEQHLEASAERSDADHVPVADRGHGDHQEVDAVPIRQTLIVGEVWRITRILQLKQTCQKTFILRKVK